MRKEKCLWPIPHENEPEYAPGRDVVPPVATRILGCMNFMCFLTPDDDLPEITDEGPLLSTRDAYACIDVYPLPSENAGKLGIYQWLQDRVLRHHRQVF